MKKTAFGLSAILLATNLGWAHEEVDYQKDCAKAAVAFLREKGVLAGGDNGLCISSLDNLPQVDIGLGSKTFPPGNNDNFVVSPQVKSSLQTVKDILMASMGPTGKFSFVGYADGTQNVIPRFDEWAGEDKTFTKADVRKELASDTNTLASVIALLKDVPDSEAISVTDTSGNKGKALSLIRNYFLASSRAKKVCEVTLGDGNCEKQPISGYASPILEANNHKECGARRRAVMSFDLGEVKVRHRQGGDGTLYPSFSSPDGILQRNMQLAASLDIFKKIKDKNIPPSEIESNYSSLQNILPQACKQNGEQAVVNQQNTARLISHAMTRLMALSDNKLKDNVLNGNFAAVKEELENIIDRQEANHKKPGDDEAYEALSVLIKGYDPKLAGDSVRKAPFNSGIEISPTSAKPIEIEIQNPDKSVEGRYPAKLFRISQYGKQDKLSWVFVDKNGRARETDAMTHGMYAVKTPEKTVMISTNERSPLSSYFEVFNSKLPKASSFSPSTDLFNCFSTTAAVEETIASDDGAQVLDPQLLTNGENLNIRLFNQNIRPMKGDPSLTRGWICQACGSGVQVDNNGALSYRPRDISNTGASYQSVVQQRDSKELTLGSMKYPKIFNISRDSLGDSCGKDENVCSCFKRVSKESGKLDSILSSQYTSLVKIPSAANQIKAHEAKVNFADSKNNCLFIPPIPHTCQVDPRGGSADRRLAGKSAAMSCKLLDKLKEYYKLTADIDIAKYKDRPLGGSICASTLRPNEESDCGIKVSPKSSTSGASKQ